MPIISTSVTPATTWTGEPTGTVIGAGSVASGAQVTLLASPHTSYIFVKWTEGGTTVSTSRRYIFTAGSTDRDLVAHFAWMFQHEINQVDPTKNLNPVINASTHGLFEFSYSGLTVTGGTELAVEYAACELLEAMGFRWYTSAPWGTVRPTSISTSLAHAKTSYWFPNNALTLAFGHSWIDCVPQSTTGFGRQLQWQYDLEDGIERFKTLNGLRESPWPTGHRWEDVIGGHLPWFESIGTEGVKRKERMLVDWTKLPAPYGSETANSWTGKFNLTAGHLTAAEYGELTTLCAAELLRAGRTVTSPRSQIEILFTRYNRTHFDPSDGDANPSNVVYPFTKAVVTKMRAGTPAIDTIPAQAPAPGCQIGVYAYAGHREPPSEPASATPPGDYRPGVYTRIALGFNGTGLTYEELMHEHGLRADAIAIREYWDTQVWSNGMPLKNARMKRGSYDSYDTYYLEGVKGVSTEYTTNWLANLVGFRYVLLKCKNGIETFDTALNDVMAKLFQKPGGGEDPAARQLYDFWGAPQNKFNKFTLRQSFDIVNTMQASWYKTLFQKYLIICYKRWYLPPHVAKADNPSWPTPKAGDLFPEKFTSYMGNVVAMAMQEVMHSYATVRNEANTAVKLDYPYLWSQFRNNTAASAIPGFPTGPNDPDWFVNGIEPIIGGAGDEWAPAHARLIAETPHDSALDSSDLVLVRGVTPVVVGYTPTKYPDAPGFFGRYVNALLYIGPGTVVFTQAIDGVIANPGTVTTASYGPGLHFIETPNDYILTSHVGGELFMDTFLGCWRDSHLPSASFQFLYIPGRTQTPTPTQKMETTVRWSFFDETVDAGGLPLRLDLPPPNHVNFPDANARLQTLGPGQIVVENGNTRAQISNFSSNRWMSRKASLALLPRAIAAEDFPNRAKVHVV